MIDFTPFNHEVEFEGIRTTQPGFRDGATTVTFSPPGGWTVEGAGAVLHLHPTGGALASARVEVRPLPAYALGTEDSIKAAQKFFASTLPPEAQGLKWETEVEKNPVLFNQHETIRLEATYTVLGQSCRASILTAHLQEQQIYFVFTSRDREFAKMHEAWRQSFFTWQGLK
jgi:hypothetical protein